MKESREILEFEADMVRIASFNINSNNKEVSFDTPFHLVTAKGGHGKMHVKVERKPDAN